MKQQYPQIPVQINHSGRNLAFLIIILVVVCAIAVVAFVFLVPQKASVSSVCGNNVCEGSENCYSCPQDCKCAGANSYCDASQKKCITATCGNGVCEPFESTQNCCNDCGCQSSYQTCNKTSHVCTLPELNISDERVQELATQYYLNKNETVSSFGIISSTIYNGQPAKSIGARIQGDLKVHILYVNANEQVFERVLE